MVFEVLKDAEGELCFATATKTRRGRGVLFALAPWLVYLLALSVLFALALSNLSPPEWAKRAAAIGAWAAAALSPVAYALGRRARQQVEVTSTRIRILQNPPWGALRLTSIPIADLTGLAIDPSVRSLGADLLLVALHRDGRRIAIAQGDPHLGQLRELGWRAAQVTGLPLQPPRFSPVPENPPGPTRSQAEQ
jgi:hypothetical protein